MGARMGSIYGKGRAGAGSLLLAVMSFPNTLSPATKSSPARAWQRAVFFALALLASATSVAGVPRPVVRITAAPPPSGTPKPANGHSAEIRWIRFSPDGQEILTGSNDGTARLWSTSDGRPLATIAPVKATTGSISEATAIAFAPDGTICTASNDHVVRIWSPDGTKLLRSLPLDAKGAHGVAAVTFTPDGKHVVASTWHGPIEIRDVASGALVRALPLTKQEDAAHHLAVSPEGALLVAMLNNGILARWRLEDGARADLADNALQYSGEVSFSPDGKRIAYTAFDGIEIRRRDGSLIASFPGISVALAWTPDGRRLVVGTGRSLQILAPPSKKVVRELPTSSILTLAIANDGDTVAVVEEDGELGVWKLR